MLLIAAIIFLDSGFLYKNTTAVSVGGEDYSPAEMNYQYASQYYNWVNQYGSYASMFGLDTSTGLSGLGSQDSAMSDGGTWKDFFLDRAVETLVQNKALLDYAAENGITLTDDEKATIDSDVDSVASYAKLQGYSSADNFLAANYGTGVNTKIAKQIGYESSLASKAAQEYSDSLEYTDAQLEEQYASYNGERDYFDIVYYYSAAETVAAEDGTEAATEGDHRRGKGHG